MRFITVVLSLLAVVGAVEHNSDNNNHNNEQHEFDIQGRRGGMFITIKLYINSTLL